MDHHRNGAGASIGSGNGDIIERERTRDVMAFFLRNVFQILQLECPKSQSSLVRLRQMMIIHSLERDDMIQQVLYADEITVHLEDFFDHPEEHDDVRRSSARVRPISVTAG